MRIFILIPLYILLILGAAAISVPAGNAMNEAGYLGWFVGVVVIASICTRVFVK